MNLIVYLFLFFVPSFLAGYIILHRTGFKIYGWTSIFFSFSLGIGLVGQLFYILLLSGYMNRMIWGMFILHIYVVALWQMKKIPLDIKIKCGRNETIFALIAFIAAIITIPALFLEPAFFDALERHLSFASRYIYHGRFYPIRETILSAIPQMMQMHFASMLLFGSVICAKWIHYLCFILSVIGTGLLGRMITGKKEVGIVSAVIFMFTPKVLITSVLSGVDFALVMFDLAAFICFIMSIKDNKNNFRWYLLSGIFIGFSLSTKYTGIISFGFMILLFIISGELKHWRKIFLFIMAALIVSSPWWGYNIFCYANPVYPFFENVLHPERVNIIKSVELLNNELSGFGMYMNEPTWLSHILSLARMSFSFYPYDGYIGILFFLTIPLIPWYRVRTDESKWLYIYSGLYMIYWVSGTLQIRFLLPVIPFISIISAGIIDSLLKSTSSLKKIFFVMWILAVVFQAGFYIWEEEHFFSTYTAFIKHDSTRYAPFLKNLRQAIKTVNDRHKNGEKTLLVGEARGFGLRGDFTAPTRFDFHPLAQMINESRDVNELREKLGDMGYRYIIFDLLKFNDLQRNGLFHLNTPAAKDIFESFWNNYLRFIGQSGTILCFEMI